MINDRSSVVRKLALLEGREYATKAAVKRETGGKKKRVACSRTRETRSAPLFIGSGLSRPAMVVGDLIVNRL